MLRRILLLALALVVLLGTMPGQAALADERVPEFHLSDSPDGPGVTNFGSGIRGIFAIFQYQDTARTKVAVRLTDSAGTVMFEQEKEYTGSGQEAIEITGQMVYQNYFDQAATKGAHALTALDAALAASGQSQVLSQLLVAAAEGRDFRGSLSTLNLYPVDSITHNSLTQALARMDSFLQLSADLNYQLSEAELHDRAQQMKEDLQAAMQLADEAKSTGGDGANFGFLDTPEGQSNTANLYVNGSLVESIEWSVSASGVGAVSSPTPTTTATPTRTPTSTTVAGAGPSATPSPTRTATLPSARAATQTPVPPSPTRPPGGYPGPTATLVATAALSATPTGPTPTGGATPSPTVGELGVTSVTPVGETSTVVAPEGVVTTTGVTPTVGPTRPVPQRRATPPPEAAAPGTGLPLGTVGVVAGAVILGLVALWFRRQV